MPENMYSERLSKVVAEREAWRANQGRLRRALSYTRDVGAVGFFALVGIGIIVGAIAVAVVIVVAMVRHTLHDPISRALLGLVIWLVVIGSIVGVVRGRD